MRITDYIWSLNYIDRKQYKQTAAAIIYYTRQLGGLTEKKRDGCWWNKGAELRDILARRNSGWGSTYYTYKLLNLGSKKKKGELLGEKGKEKGLLWLVYIYSNFGGKLKGIGD
ncbi:Hypothetical predicted protein [Olea europaea subsp. europaea]|uniref:Uncharacterized protein n=1 Tax=Olea europaea subsp. europaea TaxID=158383 RepID=A0A8S0THJ3_OLEEU|nr:Hypothetical predicted protein [Olea europaea subsp. europaea]